MVTVPGSDELEVHVAFLRNLKVNPSKVRRALWLEKDGVFEVGRTDCTLPQPRKA